MGAPRVDARLEARLLPLPRLDHGALGRPRLDRVHRRHGHRRRPRPQRAATEPLLGHRGRTRGDGVGGGRAPHRPGHHRAEGSPATGAHVPDRHEPRSHRRGRRDQGGAGGAAALRRVAPRRARPPRRPARPRLPHPAARVGGQAPAGVRVHHRGAEDPRGTDGTDGGGADRIHGHGHARGRPVGPVALAVRLLPAALRAGHQPAPRRHPRGARHVDGRHDRARGQPAAPGAHVVPPGGAAPPGHHQRGAGQAPLHQRRQRHARVQAVRDRRPVPGRRGRGRAAPGPRRCPSQGDDGHRGRGQDHRALAIATRPTSSPRSRRCCSRPPSTTT